MSTVAIDSDTGQVIRLRYLTQEQVRDLPYNPGASQYRCPDCGERVILQRPRSDPKFRPRFNHETTAECTAPAAIQGETAEHLLAKEQLARWLATVHPDSAPRIEPGAFGMGNERGFRPDVTAWTGAGMIGIEYQRSAMDVHEPTARVRAYFDVIGDPHRLHMWIFSTTAGTRHFIPGPQLHASYQTVRPTRDQSDIVRAGGTVYFADLRSGRRTLFVPVSARTFHYEIRPGELWTLHGERDPRRDWHAAQYPGLDPDAELWLLIPVDLHTCKISNNRRFLTTPAYTAASALIRAEPGREQHRRAEARARYEAAAAELDRLRRELQQADTGHGAAAQALEAEAHALAAAATHEQSAAEHRSRAEQLRTGDQRHGTAQEALTTRARPGLAPGLGRLLRGERRADLLAQRAVLQRQRDELGLQIAQADRDADAAETAAGTAHQAGARKRARAEATLWAASIGTRRAEAVARDVEQAEARIAAAEAVIAAYGQHPDAEPLPGAGA